MPVVQSSTAKKFQLPDVDFTQLAAPTTGSSENAVWKFNLAPNSGGATHQLTREEIIVLVSGRGCAMIGKERHMVFKGDALIIPANTDFSVENTSSEQMIGIAVLPVGGQVKMKNEEPFTPPWTV